MSIRKSLLITFSQSYATLALQFVASIVIARLLTPRELGIFSVAMVLISVVNTLRDFGVVNYVIQEKELNEERIRAASAVTFITAWGIALIVWLAADAAARFYREPGIADVMRILAINFWLLPFGSISMACMRREMMFKHIALIRFTAAFIQASLSIVLAWWGWSYLSMAWAAVVATLLQITMVYRLRPTGLSSAPRLRGISRVLRFGALSALSDIVRVGDRGAPDLVLGRTMGMSEVAFFSRATGLVDLFNRFIIEAVSFVALPHFAAKVRAGEDVSLAFLRGMTLLTGLSWPFFLWLAATAPTVVLVLYGYQWQASVVLVQVLCLGELLLSPFHLLDQLLIAQGMIRVHTLRITSMLCVRLLPLLLLPPYGLEGVAMGYAAANLVVVVISGYIMQHYFGISLRQMGHALVPSVGPLVCAGSVVGTLAYGLPVEVADGLLGLCIYTLVVVVATLAGYRAFRHPMIEELDKAWGVLRNLLTAS